jgi:thiol-disulfide isomerase/thioredoxin
MRSVTIAITLFLSLSLPLMAKVSEEAILAKTTQLMVEKHAPSAISTTKDIPTQSKVEKADTLIGKLAQRGYALMFFFESRCDHCHQLAPIVISVAQSYGFHVFDFSFNGQGILGFEHPAPVTQAIYRTYYGRAAPTAPLLILQNVNNLKFHILAQGGVSKEALLHRLNSMAKELL